MVVISKTFRFEASHILPLHPGKCSRLHGHSWVLTVTVAGDINPTDGMVMDFGTLSAIVVMNVILPLDHTHLGAGVAQCEWEPHQLFHPYLGDDFYPTSENLVTRIAEILQPLINTSMENTQHERPIQLHTVRLEETCTSAATWSGD